MMLEAIDEVENESRSGTGTGTGDGKGGSGSRGKEGSKGSCQSDPKDGFLDGNGSASGDKGDARGGGLGVPTIGGLGGANVGVRGGFGARGHVYRDEDVYGGVDYSYYYKNEDREPDVVVTPADSAVDNDENEEYEKRLARLIQHIERSTPKKRPMSLAEWWVERGRAREAREIAREECAEDDDEEHLGRLIDGRDSSGKKNDEEEREGGKQPQREGKREGEGELSGGGGVPVRDGHLSRVPEYMRYISRREQLWMQPSSAATGPHEDEIVDDAECNLSFFQVRFSGVRRRYGRYCR
jgi:hypothetical protein